MFCLTVWRHFCQKSVCLSLEIVVWRDTRQQRYERQQADLQRSTLSFSSAKLLPESDDLISKPPFF